MNGERTRFDDNRYGCPLRCLQISAVCPGVEMGINGVYLNINVRTYSSTTHISGTLADDNRNPPNLPLDLKGIMIMYRRSGNEQFKA